MSITPAIGWANTQFGLQPERAGLTGVGFWPRVAARLIDSGSHFAVGLGTATLFRAILVIASGGRVPLLILASLHHGRLIRFVFALLGIFAYHVIFTSVHGSSLGKLMLSMVVVQEDGSPCRLKNAFIRELGYFVDAFFFGVIGYMAMERTPQQQRYGDQWAHTVVCKRDSISHNELRATSTFMVALVFALLADSALMMIGMLIRIVI